jgi:hypothetical protein
MGARWYNPGTGGFVSRDDVIARGGSSILFNRYTYGNGDPINTHDPDGRWGLLKKAAKGFGKFVKNHGHTVLDVVGMIPVIGEAADVINGVWYAAEGDWKNAALSFAGAIPGLGAAATATKWGARGVEAARGLKNSKLVGKASKGVDTVRNFGKGADFAKGLGKGADLAKGFGKAAGSFRSIAKMGGKIADLASYGGKVGNKLGRAGGKIVGGVQDAVAAARRAREIAHTAAKSAAAMAAKKNPLPVLAAALKPNFAGMSKLVSSSSKVPASVVSQTVDTMQDSAKIFDNVRATLLKPSENVIETVSNLADASSMLGITPDMPGVDLLQDVLGRKGRNKGNGDGDSCDRQGNSFTPDTLVEMRDGPPKKIKDVKRGEWVRADDPTKGPSKTDEVQYRQVTDLIIGEGEKNLVEITVITYSGTHTITATDGHPFWVSDQGGRWVNATDLQPESMLRTSAGTWVEVSAVNRWTEHERVHNLTVDGLHTYYVLAGNTPVLVHNCDTRIASSDQGRAHNAAAFEENGHNGFSGVYDPATDTFHARQSGGDGALVSRAGGHGQINREVFGGSRNAIGFVAIRGDDGVINMRWNSASVNVRNFGQRAAPEVWRGPIMDSIRRATGLGVVG